jgi:predicted MFS family arabinose efflux permease
MLYFIPFCSLVLPSQRARSGLGTSSRIRSRLLIAQLFPRLTGYLTQFWHVFDTLTAAGIVSSLQGVALSNYLLEISPDDERPMYLAWYTLVLNAAILIGSLVGPMLAQRLGLVPALVVVAVGRALSAGGIWLSGRFPTDRSMSG